MPGETPERMYELSRNSAMLRTQRRQLKERIARREVDVVDVVMDTPWYAQDMRVIDLLEAAPQIGSVTIEKLNVRAAKRGVNLLRPISRQSQYSRAWLAQNIPAVARADAERARAEGAPLAA